MAFESLLNTPATEDELERRIITEVQANFSSFQHQSYFFKLSRCEESSLSQIVWIQSYIDPWKMIEYFDSGEKQKACIMLKFDHPEYDILCWGFWRSHRIRVWPDRTKGIGFPIACRGDVEEYDQIPRELLNKAFGEIAETLSSSRKIPVRPKKFV